MISITNTLFDLASSPDSEELLTTMRDEVLAEAVPHAKASSIVDAKPPSNVDIRDSTDPSLHPRRLPIASTSSWGKAALARMTHIDSALRESMRLNGFVARGIMKMVVAPGGVTLPDGSRIPYGTKVGIQAYSVHRDEDLYDDANTYNAFRFVSRPGGRKADHDNGPEGSISATGSETESTKGRGSGQPQALVSTSPTFLAFSHGPNAW